MAKLTKQQSKNHDLAVRILEKEKLSYEDKIFIIANWREDHSNNTGVAGAFFTPSGLARDMSIEVPSGCQRIIDLCAGIGTLSFNVLESYKLSSENLEIVCIELNPDYIEVGKKILPEATWIQGSALDKDLIESLGHFDCAISNPPFGSVPTGKSEYWLNYSGGNFEFKVIEIASTLASYGVFIIPQQSCGFEFSGKQGYKKFESRKYKAFTKQTGLSVEMNCGFDTSYYLDKWHGVKPVVEIALCDFSGIYTD